MISVQTVNRFRTWIAIRPSLLRFGAPIVLLGILLTPSIWMLNVIPPLWRDVDAYAQTTLPPGPGTILHYDPLYCFAARIPLYLGYAIDCLRGGGPLPSLRFFVRPILADSGVFALLISQHVALCCSAFYLIALTSRVFWIRLVLAASWALNPLFYTFAHCIGAETLSMILILLIGATGLRITRCVGKVPRKEWLVLGILLWLSILTRHINALLAALMPAALIFLVTYYLVTVSFNQPQAPNEWRWVRAKQALQKAILAFAVGFSSIALANASVRVLCYAARIPYYSTWGVTFVYRLKFLTGLTPEKRSQLLDEVTKHAASADIKKVISLLRGSFPSGTSNWDAHDFNQQARALLFTWQTDPYGEKYAALLNRTALAFLYPPHDLFLAAVATDFERSQKVTIPSVVSFLFVSTRFYFSHPGAMPQCESLVTFRDKSADQIFAIFKRHSYFRHSKDLDYRDLFFFWLISLALFVVVAKMRKKQAAEIASYATALTLVGLLTMLATCSLTVFQPRFTLPMWELIVISASILSAKTLEYIFVGRTKTPQQFAPAGGVRVVSDSPATQSRL